MMFKKILLGNVLSIALLSGFIMQVDAAPIHDAASNNDIDGVFDQIERGVDINTPSNGIVGYTALMRAAERGHAEIVSALILSGANINLSDRQGRTALMLAVARGHIDIVKRLLEEPEIDIYYRHFAALKIAYKIKNDKIAQLLEDAHSARTAML